MDRYFTFEFKKMPFFPIIKIVKAYFLFFKEDKQKK